MNWKLNKGMTATAKTYFEELEEINLTEELFDIAIYKLRHKLGVDPTKEMSVTEHKIWRKALSGRILSKRINDIGIAMNLVGDLDYPTILERFWKDLDKEFKKQWLLKAWMHTDSALLQGFKWWKRKFKEADFITNCNKKRGCRKIKLYRGCSIGLENGLSWTNDIEVARHYAAQKETNEMIKGVYEITVLPIQILAILKVEAVIIDKENNFIKKGSWNTETYDKKFQNLEYLIDTNLSQIKLLEIYDLKNIR